MEMMLNNFKKLAKDKKGSALILTIIVLVNAILIVSAVSVISIMQQKASSATRNATPAFQKADSGIEYLIMKIEEVAEGGESDTVTVVDLCEDEDKLFGAFNENNDGACVIADDSSIEGLQGIKFYFLKKGDDGKEIITNSTDTVSDINYARAVGEAGSADEAAHRALEVMFDTTTP